MLVPPLLLIYALVTARLSGLVVADKITEFARVSVLRRLRLDRPVQAWFADLIQCQWCTSIWVAGLGAAPISYIHIQAIAPLPPWLGNSWLLIPALTLAYSQAAGMMSGVGRDGDD